MLQDIGRRGRITCIVLALLSLAGIIYLLNWQTPFITFKYQDVVTIPLLPVFLIVVGVFIGSLTTFFTRKVLQGILLSTCFLVFLTLRYFGITHWLFILFILLFLVLVEVLLKQG